MSTDPGHPQPDVMALQKLRTVLADTIRDHTGEVALTDGWVDSEMVALALMEHFPTAQFEHDVNSNGVAVRRVIVRGEWEVDPAPPRPGNAGTYSCVACGKPMSADLVKAGYRGHAGCIDWHAGLKSHRLNRAQECPDCGKANPARDHLCTLI
jgi:hypothetical protein